MDADLVINGVSVIAVVYGLIQAAKTLGLSEKVAPAAAILLGIVASAGYALAPTATEVVIRGAALGVGASIGYAGFKKTATNA